jgi:hypothetical protein
MACLSNRGMVLVATHPSQDLTGGDTALTDPCYSRLGTGPMLLSTRFFLSLSLPYAIILIESYSKRCRDMPSILRANTRLIETLGRPRPTTFERLIGIGPPIQCHLLRSSLFSPSRSLISMAAPSACRTHSSNTLSIPSTRPSHLLTATGRRPSDTPTPTGSRMSKP